jgi:NADH-quinone oxidoreductase subunit N
MISLAYYLRVIAAVWMRPAYHADPTPEAGQRVLPAMAGGSHEADVVRPFPADAGDGSLRGRIGGVRCPVIIGLTVLAAGATVFFGVIPSPLVDFVAGAGESITDMLG